MKYLMNISLGTVLVITAFSLNIIYGNGLIGFLALMAFTFFGILIVLAANGSS